MIFFIDATDDGEDDDSRIDLIRFLGVIGFGYKWTAIAVIERKQW